MWSLTKGSEGDSFSCIQMMLNPTLSTRFSYLLLLTHNPHLSFAPALVPFFLGDYSAVLSLIRLPHSSSLSLFISFLSSFYRLLSPISPRTWIYLLLPSPPPRLPVSLFSFYLSVFLSSFPEITACKRFHLSPPWREDCPADREAWSAFQSFMMSQPPRSNTLTSKTPTHIIRPHKWHNKKVKPIIRKQLCLFPPYGINNKWGKHS